MSGENLNKKVRRAFFTGNYAIEEKAKYENIVRDFLSEYDSVCAIASHEIGESGNHHIQGMIRLKNPISIKTWRSRLPGFHIDNRENSDEKGRNYCRKDDQWWAEVKDTEKYQGKPKPPASQVFLERGDFTTGTQDEGRKKGGQKTAEMWNDIKNMCYNHPIAALDLIEDKYPMIFMTQIKLIEYHIRKAWERLVRPYDHCDAIWCYGPTTTGKTTWAKEQLGDSDDWSQKHSGNKWFCCITPGKHSGLLIDDVTPENFKLLINDLLAMARGHVVPVEVKGMTIKVSFNRIFITSNYSIDRICELGHIPSETCDALKARFKSHHFIGNPFAKPTRTFVWKDQAYQPEVVDGNDDLREELAIIDALIPETQPLAITQPEQLPFEEQAVQDEIHYQPPALKRQRRIIID